jgi:hypothetical protein
VSTASHAMLRRMRRVALVAWSAVAALACAPTPRIGAKGTATATNGPLTTSATPATPATPAKSAAIAKSAPASKGIAQAPENAATESEGMLRSHGYAVWLDDQTGDTTHAGQLAAWVERALAAVSETTGGAAEQIHIVAVLGAGGASTRGRTITLRLEDGPRPRRPSSEWVLPHELIHASFPSLWDPDLWLEEGLATYLEPLVRVRAGQLREEDMWRDLVRDLPQGRPRPGEGGLHGTHTWHRLYWQGAVFWLQAELAIFQRTGGQHNLTDALCAWARLEDSDDFGAEQAFTAMDAALGQPILFDLYRRASARGIEQDPTRLLAELGVVRTSSGVSLREDAPAAGLRRSLVEPSPRPCTR